MKASTFKNSFGVSALVLSALASQTTTAQVFSAVELSAGYALNADPQQTATPTKAAATEKAQEHKCGEGKCGEGKCGGKAEDKKAAAQATDASKAQEHKCGEGKCGEGKCGGMN